VRSERKGRGLELCWGWRMTGNGHRRRSEDDDLILRPEGRCSGHVPRLGRQLQQAERAVPIGRAIREEGNNLIASRGGHRRRTGQWTGDDAGSPTGKREGIQRHRGRFARAIAAVRSNPAVEAPRYPLEDKREGEKTRSEERRVGKK